MNDEAIIGTVLSPRADQRVRRHYYGIFAEFVFICLYLRIFTATSPVLASTSDDLVSWKGQFEVALRTHNNDVLYQLIDQVKFPVFDPDGINRVLNDVDAHLAGQQIQNASAIDDRAIGKLFRRISFGVRYSTQIICYNILFVGVDDGWQAANIDAFDNINKCLSAPWPTAEKSSMKQ